MEAVLTKFFVVDPTSELVEQYKELLADNETDTRLGRFMRISLKYVVFLLYSHFL
jgi:hypothetical protein